MFKGISRTRLASVWCVAVLAIGALSVIAGAAVSLSNAELLLVTCLVPPAVMFAVWRGAPPATVAELLHAVNGPSQEPQP